MISLNQPTDNGPQSTAATRGVALLLAAFAVLAATYAAGIAVGAWPFNSGTWVVGEALATRGWVAYLLTAAVHLVVAYGIWRAQRWANWLGVLLLAVGLMPAIPGISAAVVDLRIGGIALWGTLIILRTAALYVLLS